MGRKYITYTNVKDNKKPYVLQINDDNKVSVFRYRFEANRDRDLNAAKRGKKIVIAEERE